MYAAAEGHSTLGIPQSVGREFVSIDADPDAEKRAAGVIIIDPDGNALFLKRDRYAVNPGTWCFPGGMAEAGETPAENAAREATEETGYQVDPDDLLGVERTTRNGVDFSTFVLRVPKQFMPEGDDEHVGSAWVPLEEPPEPVHPGVAATIDQLPAIATKGAAIRERMRAGATDTMAMDWAVKLEQTGVFDRSVRAGIAFDRESVRDFDADGRLHVATTNISKAAVNPYIGKEIPDCEKLGLDPNKTYMLLRDPEELKKAAPTFNNLPVLNEHIAVNAEDHKPDAVIGSTGTDSEYAHPFLKNSLVVWAKSGIDGIESDEQKELSSAYRYRADMTPGVYEGKRYDGVMRDIVGNHVAVVKKGRAGPDVVVGDSSNQEPSIMSKGKLSSMGVLLQGALTAALLPKLAQDAAIDLHPVLSNISKKNFSKEKANLLKGLTAALDGKLAKDASIEDVTGLLDKLEKVGDELEDNAALPAPGGKVDAKTDDDDEAMDANPVEAIKQYLAGCVGKTLTQEDLDKLDQVAAGQAGDAEGDKPFPPKKDDDAGEEEKVDKKAMDAAIKLAADSAEKKGADRALKMANAIREAERMVKPFVGELAIAFDSADAVYRKAFEMLGVDVKDVHPSAFPAILKAQSKPAQGKRTVVAQDAATSESDFATRWPEAGRIQVG